MRYMRYLHSFEIFQDDVRPPLGFGSVGSRSTRSANPENSTLVPNMWIVHYWLFSVVQVKAAILFPASRPYGPYSLGTLGCLPHEL